MCHVRYNNCPGMRCRLSPASLSVVMVSSTRNYVARGGIGARVGECPVSAGGVDVGCPLSPAQLPFHRLTPLTGVYLRSSCRNFLIL